MGFSKTNTVQMKFDANTMHLLAVDPVRDGWPAEKAVSFFDKIPERLKAVGSVRSVALAAQAPFSVASGTAQLVAANDASPRTHDAARTLRVVGKETVGSGYFAALSEPLLAGREFAERDQSSGPNTAPLAAVLDESAARALFGNRNAVGRRVTEGTQAYDVVGVVRDVKHGMADDDDPVAVMYVPLTSRDFANPPPGGITIMVRSNAGADALAGIRREVASIDPNLDVFDVRTLGKHLELSRATMRLAVETYAGMGVFGLVLAAIGLAGVTAYAVARRRKEIGIRMALGARKAQVLRLVLREGAALAIVGSALGFLGAMAIVKVLSSLTTMFADSFNVSVSDPLLVVGAPVLLAALAMLACYLPARKSAKIDPLKTLREE
jgi:macrolide transport system ATP-binding/permease protein